MKPNVKMDGIGINSGDGNSDTATVHFRIGDTSVGQIDTINVWFHHRCDKAAPLDALHSEVKAKASELLKAALVQLGGN